MKTGLDFAENALLPKWDKYRYDQLDCQGFVEAVLKDIGIRKSDGSVYNWRGSNAMYRNFYSWRGTVEECKKKFGSIPVGAFVYVWKPDGADEVGYTDDLGVGTRTMQGFTRVTLFSGLDYFRNNSYNETETGIESVMAIIDSIHNQLIDLEGVLNELFRSN